MNARSMGIALFAIGLFIAAAIYVLLNPLRWDDPPIAQRREASSQPLAAAASAGQAPAGIEAPALRPGSGPGIFDIARIDPKGPSVFAGQAKPRETVSVLVDDVVVGTVEADANGEWVLVTEAPITAANPKLTLAYGARPPAPAKVAEPAASRVAGVQPGAGAPLVARDPRSVRDVDARLIRELGELVQDARRDDHQNRASGASPASGPGQTGAQSGQGLSATAASGGAATAAGSGEAAAGLDGRRTALASATAGAARPSARSARGGLTTTGEILPVPIRFVFREAQFTEFGRAAAVLMLEYLKLKNVTGVTLTGHADERGAHELNMQLSAERLKTVEMFLRNGGYRGTLNLVPKGKTEPFGDIERGQLPQDVLFELDRRVELKITR